MTPAELERANTWFIEIVETIVENVQWCREGDECRAVGHGGLSINTRKGCWHQHSTGNEGWSVVPLVMHLKGYDNAAATEWVEVFLRAHPGTGRAIAGEHDQEREIESAALTQAIIDKLLDPTGTPAEVYLRSRGITGPIPDFVYFLPAVRCGEGAVAALLKSHDRVVGVQLGYIDPNGRKTTVPPYRRRHMREKAPDAVFQYQR